MNLAAMKTGCLNKPFACCGQQRLAPAQSTRSGISPVGRQQRKQGKNSAVWTESAPHIRIYTHAHTYNLTITHTHTYTHKQTHISRYFWRIRSFAVAASELDLLPSSKAMALCVYVCVCVCVCVCDRRRTLSSVVARIIGPE